MIESIGIALAKALATYLFKVYLFTTSKINIEGAPYWYLRDVPAQVCVYDYKYGGYSAVDSAKAATYPKMRSEISNIVEIVIYENFLHLKSRDELNFVKAFKSDENLPVFVRSKMKHSAVEYKKSRYVAFVRGCIEKDEILDYQNKRIESIKYKLSHKRAGDAFSEMESGDMSLED